MKELKPRERVERALRHEPVDRVPLFYRMKHEAKEKLARIYGIEDASTGRKHNPDLELRLGNDIVLYQIGINADFSHRPIAIGETWYNHFGVGYGKSGLQMRTPEEEVEFAKTQEFWGPAKVVPENFPSHHPITSMEDLKSYTWPDPADPALLDPIDDICKRYQDDYFIIVDLSSTLIEAAYAHVVGTQNFFLFLFDQPELIEGVLDGLTEYYTELGRNCIKRGVDMVRVGDDVGAQQSMMLSPEQWRELAKPRFKYMFDTWRKDREDIFVKFHSCGDYSPIIGDEVELGVDLSGLMQPTGGNKDQVGIKRKYGDDLAFVGGFDVQRLLPRGQVEEVRHGVLEVMKNLAVGGGYIFSPAHYILADVPVQNIYTMLEAQREFGTYGRYPLN
ncbi:MAG: uroporphyrinogen decarboxylase family protein [Hyphomicrobiales bacterium]|nr:uroporphyrinogen decarboxylase family protein [Hyphomicrobiales bacterium]